MNDALQGSKPPVLNSEGFSMLTAARLQKVSGETVEAILNRIQRETLGTEEWLKADS